MAGDAWRAGGGGGASGGGGGEAIGAADAGAGFFLSSSICCLSAAIFASLSSLNLSCLLTVLCSLIRSGMFLLNSSATFSPSSPSETIQEDRADGGGGKSDRGGGEASGVAGDARRDGGGGGASEAEAARLTPGIFSLNLSFCWRKALARSPSRRRSKLKKVEPTGGGKSDRGGGEASGVAGNARRDGGGGGGRPTDRRLMGRCRLRAGNGGVRKQSDRGGGEASVRLSTQHGSF